MKIFLSVLVLLSFLANNAVAGIFSPTEGQSFSDPYVDFLVEREIIQGYGDGIMRVDDKVTRAEFLKIALELAKYADEIYPMEDVKPEDIKPDMGNAENCFSDVRQEWHSPYVCYAKEQNIVQGYKDGKFYPNQPITFIEASAILVKVFKLEIDEYEAWYRGHIERLNRRQIIPPNILSLEQEIKRSAAAVMATRLFTDSPGSYYCPLTLVDFQNDGTIKFTSHSCP